MDLVAFRRRYQYSKLFKLFSYIFRLTEKISGYKQDKNMFFEKKGYKPNLKSPITLSEKLMWKKIYDRNPLLTITADKYKVRTYIEETLGPEKASELLVPLLYTTDKPETIPFNDLPDRFIVKSNHASGWNMVVDKEMNSPVEVIRECRKWLNSSYGIVKNEWAYINIKPMVVVEELLVDESGNLPKNIKFYMFHRKCKYVRISNNHNNLPSSSYTPDWEYLPLKHDGKTGPEVEKPGNYEQMLVLAEILSQNLDFVRVDFYNINGKIYFSELTHYPNSAKVKIPFCFDLELGQYLSLERNYWFNLNN